MWGLCANGFCQQPLSLGGLGKGGLNGNGFGDPIANDYSGIDWGYNFQTGMIIKGYDTSMKASCNNNTYGSYTMPTPLRQMGYWENREAEMDAYFRMRLKNRMYREREKRYDKYRSSGAWKLMTFEQYEANMSAAGSIYKNITGQ